MADHSYKKPGMTLWESLGLDIPANAPGGQRMVAPSYLGPVNASGAPLMGTRRVTHSDDRDANHHPGYEES